MNYNDEAMSAILQGVSRIIAEQLANAPFDKTRIGLIVDRDLETNTYTVRIDGYDYSNVESMNKYNINDSVVVMCPQNQTSQMFIYGKIDTTDYTED